MRHDTTLRTLNTANKPALPYNSQNHLIHLYNGDCVHCKVRTACLHTINTNFVLLSPFQGSDRLSPSSRQGGPGSTPGPIRMRSAADKVAVGRVFLRVLQFPLISIIPPMLHPYLHPHAALTIKIGRQYLGTFKIKALLIRTSGGIGTNSVHAPRRHVKLLSAWRPQQER